MKPTNTDPLLAKIVAGAHRGHYLVYARKSTDEPENQKNSIAYQKAEARTYARRAGLPLAPLTLTGFCTDGVISERHSAFKEAGDLEFGEDGSVRYQIERPKFHRLAAYLAKARFKGVIFLCWDRASRNKGDELILRRLMKAGVDVHFVLATYDDTSAGELHKDIDGMFAEHHSRVTREKVKGVMAASRAKGLCTHKAPVGYLNLGSMEHKPVDPERGPVIRRLFELAAESTWTLSDLRRWLISQGFTMPPARRRRTREQMLEDEERDGRQDGEKVAHIPSVSMVHAVLRNPFYTGKVLGPDGGWVESVSHEALVGEELFECVQRVLARRRTSARYEKKLELPFRGFVRCACGRVYTPYTQKGFVYYGARCDRSCPNGRKSVNLTFLNAEIARLLSGLVFHPDELALLDASTTTRAVERVRDANAAREAKERNVKKLREDLAYLAANRLTLLRTGAYEPAALVAEEARLTAELAALEEEPQVSVEQVRAATASIANLSELVLDVASSYATGVRDDLETFARIVFSELSLSAETLNFQLQESFAAFDRRILSESALSSRLSEYITLGLKARSAAAELLSLLPGAERPEAARSSDELRTDPKVHRARRRRPARPRAAGALGRRDQSPTGRRARPRRPDV